MGRLFGTDGVRGVAGVDLTEELAYKLGRAGADVLGRKYESPVFVIGRDTRVSGKNLENALAKGIIYAGGRVVNLGIITTPAVAYLAREESAAAGAVISASHNPYRDNGIKFFNGEGYKLDDAVEDEIETAMRSLTDTSMECEIDTKCISKEYEAEDIYINYLMSTFDRRLDGMKIALDCANGASFRVAPELYKRLGAEVAAMGIEPDGKNINDGVGSTHTERFRAFVQDRGAEVGFAFDGDADRLIVIDENGNEINGDKTICLCAGMLKKNGRLKGNKVTATIMSNIGLHRYVEAIGGNVDVTAVGDRYVLESMRNTGCVIGGEQSGHIIFLDYSTTGDGILSSLQFTKAWMDSGKTTSQFADEVHLYPQALENASVSKDGKEKYSSDPDIVKAIEEAEESLEGKGRVLIRPSGTESLVRVMIEGEHPDEISEMAGKLAKLISNKFPQ